MSQSATITSLTTWRERNGARPLREVSAEQGARLRAALAPRPAPQPSAVQERIARLHEVQPRTVRATPAVATVGDPARPTYAQVDALAATVPTGMYALPRREASTAGNTMTFFKVHQYRGGHRIVQLLGSVGAFAERPLPLVHQLYALTHISEDVRAAAVLFGQETGTCGRCGSPLTNDASRARGLGPHCARQY